MPSETHTKIAIHVWHVEMTERPDILDDSARLYELRKCETPLPEMNRFLYATVGAPWMWYMRLTWTWQQWHDYLNRPVIETWVAYQGGTPIGYFELEKQADYQTEIAYFGLIPEFVGKGLGKQLLEDAIQHAWILSNSGQSTSGQATSGQATSGKANPRIWLHTCTLDHPSALPNYLARGFKVFKEEDFEDMVPAQPLEPWPGARKPPKGA